MRNWGRDIRARVPGDGIFSAEDLQTGEEWHGLYQKQIRKIRMTNMEKNRYIDAMDDDTFGKLMDYHFTICERQDLIGASHHTLDILQKE